MSVFTIAEIGINHNGDLDVAMRLIEMAAGCGVDAVKFQKRTIDLVYDEEVLSAPRESPWGTTQRQQKEALEFGRREYDRIDATCREKGIDWFASAWDPESQRFLQRYDLKYNKIASAMLTYTPLLEMIASERKHTFISTGMSTLEDIDRAVELFRRHECPFTLMHCVSVYPCSDENCNLMMIPFLRERYDCPVGYSGHEVGVMPSVLAVSVGATALERHITLDRAMYGSDQAASLEKRGLELVVNYCSDVKAILGSGQKTVLAGEVAMAGKLRHFVKRVKAA